MSITLESSIDEVRLRTKVYHEHADAIFERDETSTHHRRFLAAQLSALEDFIVDTLSSTDRPFVLPPGKTLWEPYGKCSFGTQNFKSMWDYLTLTSKLSPRFTYSEPIMLFVEACRTLDLYAAPIDWSPPYWTALSRLNLGYGNLPGAEIFNRLVTTIREIGAARNSLVVIQRWRKNARIRERKYISYVDALFKRYARLVVLRIDLSYIKSLSHSTTVETACNDMEHLFNNTRSNRIFFGLVGYIVKMEYGLDKGLHWHLILFLDGSKRQGSSHIHHAKQIGEYWSAVITKGRGDYWNCNANSNEYARRGILGIGEINYFDANLCHNLKHRVVHYLCKSEQYCKPATGIEAKTIRRGLLLPLSARGRPRKRLPLSECPGL